MGDSSSTGDRHKRAFNFPYSHGSTHLRELLDEYGKNGGRWHPTCIVSGKYREIT